MKEQHKMLEFEKWNKKQRIGDLRILNKPTVDSNEKERYKGWKAALEWVYSLREPDHTDIFEEINPIWIKKELEDD